MLMCILKLNNFNAYKSPGGSFGHRERTYWEIGHQNSILPQKTPNSHFAWKLAFIPKYKGYWGKIESWWPFSQWVRPRCPNEPPGVLNTWKVFILTTDIGIIRCVACAEIANLPKKLEKSNFLGSRCRMLYMPVKKLLDGNGCLKARNFANIYSKHACDPSFDAPGSELSNALRIMSIRRIVFPRKKNFGKSRPP